jgi:hypothetical protein
MIRRASFLATLIAVGLLVALPACLATAFGLTPSLSPALPKLRRQSSHAQARKPETESRFELDAGHGYRLAVIGQNDIVIVVVGRAASFRQEALKPAARTAEAFTLYIARGIVSPSRIAASFGGFGKVDVRFHPSGQVVESVPHRHCVGVNHFTSQRGVFSGSVRFNGEEHYVTVHSHRARGRVRSPLQLHCAPPGFRSRTSTRARPVRQTGLGSSASFTATSRHGVTSTELFVFSHRGKTTSIAETEESIGSVARIRYGLAVGHSQVFSLNNALTSATLTPPAPFHGKGTYLAAPDGTRSWTGPLSISFPGAPLWPLAGEQFKPSLHAGF